MKKYLLLILFLVCSPLLYADTVYFKDGTSVEGKITSENDKLIIIKESKAGVDKSCEYLKSKIAKIEKKALKPTCNFTPNKTKAQAAKDAVKPAKSAQKAKTQEIKKVEPVKAVKPVKKAAVKTNAKEAKPKIEQAADSKKIKAQEQALKKIEQKTAQKAPKPMPSSKAAPKKVAPYISVKPLKSAQEAELHKIEKARSAKIVLSQAADSKKIKAQEQALKKIEQKTARETLKPAALPEPVEAREEVVQKKKASVKYKTVSREVRDLPDHMKMKRIESTIIVPGAVDSEELKLIFSELLEKELAVNKELDGLWVITYFEVEYPDGLPKAYGIWSPPGGWYDWQNTSDKSQYKWEYRFLRGDSISR